jgi:hypothetical protein
MRGALAAAALLSVACGRPLPAPRILGVAPAEIVHGTVPELRIDLDVIFPFFVRYGPSEVFVNTGVEATIGGLALRRIDIVGDGDLAAFAPFALPVGTHDVRVELADGRAATLAASLTVVPGAFPDSFTIGPIETQMRGQPFTLAIQAVGAQAPDFNGAVRISVSHSTVLPDISGPFVAGMREETVTVAAPGMDVTITVEDAVGHQGTSNPFDILN